MNHAVPVRIIESASNLFRECDSIFDGELCLAIQEIAE
jgi:hypothetical protein